MALTIPPAVLRALNVAPGVPVDLCVADGRLIVEPRRRPQYQLAELLKDCEAQPVADGWDTLPPVGGEVL